MEGAAIVGILFYFLNSLGVEHQIDHTRLPVAGEMLREVHFVWVFFPSLHVHACSFVNIFGSKHLDISESPQSILCVSLHRYRIGCSKAQLLWKKIKNPTQQSLLGTRGQSPSMSDIRGMCTHSKHS